MYVEEATEEASDEAVVEASGEAVGETAKEFIGNVVEEVVMVDVAVGNEDANKDGDANVEANEDMNEVATNSEPQEDAVEEHEAKAATLDLENELQEILHGNSVYGGMEEDTNEELAANGAAPSSSTSLDNDNPPSHCDVVPAPSVPLSSVEPEKIEANDDAPMSSFSMPGMVGGVVREEKVVDTATEVGGRLSNGEEKIDILNKDQQTASAGNGDVILQVNDGEPEHDGRGDMEENPTATENVRRSPRRTFVVMSVAIFALVGVIAVLGTFLARATSLSSGDEEEEEVGFETGRGKAYVPIKLREFLNDVVALPPGSDGKRRLALPPDILKKLNGHCSVLENYTPSSSSEPWQCDQRTYNNFPLTGNVKGGTPYTPGEETLELFGKAVGLSVKTLKEIRIESGQANASPGDWCGMPAPGDEKDPKDFLAFEYWRKCVSPRAGYINVLECSGECDEDGCSTYAVLGYAALEGGVCYPAHQHDNEEAYWQIAGRGWWRTWTDVSGIASSNHSWASDVNYGGSKYSLHPHRAGVPHEFDTTSNLDGDMGAGHLDEPMVMVYWWGKETSVNTNYEWARQVRDNPFQYQESAATCGNYRRIPKYDPEKEQTVTPANC